MTGEQLFGLRRAQNAFLTRKSARIMSGGQDLIPQTALLTNSPRKTAAGSTFIVSPDAKIARIMSGGQDSIPQNALLTNSPRKTAAGSTLIVSPDAKIRPNHARWARYDTAPGGHVKWPPTAAIFPYFRAQWYFQMTTRRDFPVKVRPVDTYFTRWTSVSLRGHLFATPPDATDATDASDTPPSHQQSTGRMRRTH